MKNELTLEHIAAYLPYGLEMISLHYFEGDEVPWVKWKLCSLSTDHDNNSLDEWWNEEGDNFYLNEDFKPILRPMSELKSSLCLAQIEEKSMDEMNEHMWNDLLSKLARCEKTNSNIDVHRLPYWVVQMLLKHHFDVFGLIEKGLAVNLNTIEQ